MEAGIVIGGPNLHRGDGDPRVSQIAQQREGQGGLAAAGGRRGEEQAGGWSGHAATATVLPLTQLRLSSLCELAKAAQPSPTRGEGQYSAPLPLREREGPAVREGAGAGGQWRSAPLKIGRAACRERVGQ